MILTIRHTSSPNSAKKDKKQVAQSAVPLPAQASSSAFAAPDSKRTTASARRDTRTDSMPFAHVRRGFKWLQLGRARKRLQMLETVSLGEKRFVALVQVDGRQFLIGGAPSNVGMLAELAPEETFHQVLREATEGLNIPAAPLADIAPKHSSSQSESRLPVKANESHFVANPITAPKGVQAVPSVQGTLRQERVEPQNEGQAGTSMFSDDSLDPALETPFSLSPTLLAAVQNSTQPAVHVTADAGPIHEERSSTKPSPTHRADAAAPFSPHFTFQLSSSFPLEAEATLRHSQGKFGRDADQRMVSAWHLKGATS